MIRPIYRQSVANHFRDNPIDDSNNINDAYETIVRNITAAMQSAESQEMLPATFSAETRELLRKRREMKQDRNPATRIEYAELCKLIRKRTKEEIRQRHIAIVEEAVRCGRLRRARSELAEGRKQMISVKRKNDGTLASTRSDILKEVKSFYEALYKSSNVTAPIIANNGDHEFAPILECEVREVLRHIRTSGAPGKDGVTAEALRVGADALVAPLTRLFNECVRQTSVPITLSDAKTILLYKKGDPTEISNYRPISLLSTIYKILTKLLLCRILNSLEAAETPEQAGFRKRHSTIDHIQAVNELVEKTREYHLPLVMVFVDYEKAFDSVEISFVWHALRRQGAPEQIIRLLELIYSVARSEFCIGNDSVEVNIERGVRQGDTISPRLFTACLREVINGLDWSRKGIDIDGQHLSHLAFADDIVLISHKPIQMQKMLRQLARASAIVGLKINTGKTKVMSNKPIRVPLTVQSAAIEKVDQFVYLGQLITLPRDHGREISRRIRAGWNAYRKFRDLFTAKNIAMKLKRRLFNSCIAPAMLYRAETWALTQAAESRLATAQHRMERLAIGIHLIDRKTNDWIRGVTKFDDIVAAARRRKWRWAGKVANMSTDRWARKLVEWRPRIGKRHRGRPQTRWRDDIKDCAGAQWMQIASADCDSWKRLEKTYCSK
jgi:hypothetical protein